MNNIQKELLDLSVNCCGCGICASICPCHAIEIEQNAEGFYEPKVNENKCIKCKKCIMNCVFKKRKCQIEHNG